MEMVTGTEVMPCPDCLRCLHWQVCDPAAACRFCVHTRVFMAERTTLFDGIINTIGQQVGMLYQLIHVLCDRRLWQGHSSMNCLPIPRSFSA